MVFLPLKNMVQRNPRPSNCYKSAHHPTASQQLRWIPSRASPSSNSLDAIRHKQGNKLNESVHSNIQHPMTRSKLPSMDQHFQKQFHPQLPACTYKIVFIGGETIKIMINKNKNKNSTFKMWSNRTE